MSAGTPVAPLQGGEAQLLVACAYGARDLFGSEADLLGWSQRVRGDRPSSELLPAHFAPATAAALMAHLRDAGVVGQDGTIDQYRLWQFQQVIALLPYVRIEEEERRPPDRPKVVFTVPESVELPREAAHLQLSLSQRVFDALVSSNARTLLASPYWSDEGAALLRPALETSVQLGLPVTLAGAKVDQDRDDLGAMLRLARQLADDGASVTALSFLPPTPGGIFHAKLVCGSVGYLGSANLTAAGLGRHVEAGLPLDEPDVAQAWWLIDELVGAGLLVPENF